MLSLSQFTHSSALTFLALIGFLLHVTLHFPLAGGCRESTSFSGLLKEHVFLLELSSAGGGSTLCKRVLKQRCVLCNDNTFLALWVTPQITSCLVLS